MNRQTSKVDYRDKEELNELIKAFLWGTKIPPQRLQEVFIATKQRSKGYEVITFLKMKKQIAKLRLANYRKEREQLKKRQAQMAADLEEEAKRPGGAPKERQERQRNATTEQTSLCEYCTAAHAHKSIMGETELQSVVSLSKRSG